MQFSAHDVQTLIATSDGELQKRDSTGQMRGLITQTSAPDKSSQVPRMMKHELSQLGV